MKTVCKVFLACCTVLFFLSAPSFCSAEVATTEANKRPNILLIIADDWGWPHASAYGDPVVKTPSFDRVAREGVLFNHAFVSSPSCTPSRGALLTGQYHWRLEAGANLWCVLPDKFASYPELLAKAGYRTGVTSKGWGPGRTESPNRPIAGERFKSFEDFLSQHRGINREAANDPRPFCFWLGSTDPHRDYEHNSGVKSGMDLNKIKLPACFPDNDITRGDVADYFVEVQRFDKLVGEAIASLERAGELENTLIVVTSDHGMPFPRGKGNLYDTGVRVPLAMSWPAGITKPGRTVDALVRLCDLAPTFLQVAGIEAPSDMTGRSLVSLLRDENNPALATRFDHVLFGKERHVPCQEKPDLGGYPCRGIRTADFLYIRNFTPGRWPNGTPDWQNAARPGTWLGDCDNGPTKTYIAENAAKDAAHQRFFELCFGKRPAEELYDLSRDPDQLTNVAADAQYAEAKSKLNEQLLNELKSTSDLRVQGRGEEYEKHEFLGGGPKHPNAEKKKAKQNSATSR